MKKDKSNKKSKNNRLGEYIPTEFKWISLDKQKENAHKLADITNKNSEEKNEKRDKNF